MKRILSIGRIGGREVDEALIERLARGCLIPISQEPINRELIGEVVDNICDAMRDAYNRGREESR